MIVLRRQRGERELLILGITEANVERLKAGQPIRVTAETHQGAIPEGWTVGIVYGLTREEIEIQLREAGLLEEG